MLFLKLLSKHWLIKVNNLNKILHNLFALMHTLESPYLDSAFWLSSVNLMTLRSKSGKPSLQAWEKAFLKTDNNMKAFMESSLTGKLTFIKL